jgi:hypothetical protein
MLVLSTEDLEDPELIECWMRFKTEVIARYTWVREMDNVLTDLKTISKVCQALLLDSEVPVVDDRWHKGGILGPFGGSLRFISDIYSGASARRQFSLEEARALAQISSLSRALPYPSDNQVEASVVKSVNSFTTERKVSKTMLKTYKRAQTHYVSDVGAIRTTRTHTSLSASSSFESTRSEGGRSSVVVAAAKQFCELPITGTSVKAFLGKFDCFGKEILSKQTYGLFLKLSETQERQVGLGNLLYVLPEEILGLLPKARYSAEKKERAVPEKLGDIINLASTGLIMEFGSYDSEHKIEFGVPVFADKGIKRFVPHTDILPVRAGLSVEAGFKTRLTTSCPAGFVQLSQLVSNRIRDHLSKDPFVRTGFEEADKLWEVLNAYDKRWAKSIVNM